MIKSFRCKDTEKLYNKQFVKKFSGIERLAIKRLRILESANTLEALAGLPSNRLERLKGDRIGQYSIRINDQYRICFSWDDAATHVEIVDYH
ncbi:MAG: type II toxin-antitoxin system RelE/ParE family toxin [Microcystis aeruginosa]